MTESDKQTVEEIRILFTNYLEAKNKPVTEDELRDIFEANTIADHHRRHSDGEYMFPRLESEWIGFLAAAKLFGKLIEDK